MNFLSFVSPLLGRLLGSKKPQTPQNITIINNFGGQPAQAHKPLLHAAATALDVSDQDLMDRLKQGKSLDQVAKDLAAERHTDPAALLAKLHAALASTLQSQDPKLSDVDAATQAASIANRTPKNAGLNLDPSKFQHGHHHHFSHPLATNAVQPVTPSSQTDLLRVPLQLAA
jgi:hypothetical protein